MRVCVCVRVCVRAVVSVSSVFSLVYIHVSSQCLMLTVIG